MGTEYVEARVLVPADEIASFLTFCDEKLETMPALNKIPESANGHEVIKEIEAAASRSEPETAGD